MTYTQSLDELPERLNRLTALSVVVCTYNRAASLAKTLESLRQTRVPANLEWELIVVDNNSTDNTRAVVMEFMRTSGLIVRYVFEPERGLSHARNAGVGRSRGELIAFTDDDVQVSREWIWELERTFTEFDCIGVAGRVVAIWGGITKPDWFATAGPYFLGHGPVPHFERGEQAIEISTPAVGANMAFRKVAFDKYGLFQTEIGAGASEGPQLGEDYEFEYRLLHAREKIVYSPRAIVFHPATQERITKKYFLRFYLNMGRANLRLQGSPSEAALYFGIPRYMFRVLLEKCRIWLFTLGAEKRFYHKAQLYSVVGEMIEARASQRKNKSLAGLRGSQREY